MKIVERIKREFHWTRLLLRHRDWRTVAFTPWLPYNCWQILYLAWRWFTALYFIGWFIPAAIEQASFGGLFLIYLTNWGIITWVFCMIVGALVSTAKFCCYLYYSYKERNSVAKVDANEMTKNDNQEPIDHSETGNGNEQDAEELDIYADWRKDNVSWYLKCFWIIFNTTGTIQVAICFLYFIALYDPVNSTVDPGNDFNIHLTPAVVAVIDVWVSGIVMNIYHVYMPAAYGIVYGIFTLIYFGARGLDPFGRNYIYVILDYGGNPGLAAGVLLGCCLAYIPLLYIILYCLSLPRRWLVGMLRRACYKSQ